MSTAQLSDQTLTFPDRSTRLTFFGVVQILIGCLCGLMGLMMALVSMAGPMANAPQGQAMSMQAMIPAITVYGLLAVGMILLGIGSIRARRWAWTLTVVLSWMWLIMGVIAFFVLVFVAGPIMSASFEQQLKQQGQGKALPPEALAAMRVTMQIIAGAVLAGIYVILPAVFLLFYHHASVFATCQRRNPQRCWTDRCPMPVLALSIIMAFSIASMLSLLLNGCVMPVFGIMASGATGAVVILLIALLMAYLVWGTYRLQMAAWWGTLLLWIVGTANMVVTFSQDHVMQMYEKMKMPAAQLEMIRKSGTVESLSHWGPWFGLVGGIACIGYLLYVRRYFVHNHEAT
jgi:hypothetical protein